jgi:hypothetical protein
MFYILTAVLILGSRGYSDGLQDVMGLGREPDIWTINKEVIMARIAALMELQPTDRRKPQDARSDQGRGTSPNGDGLMEQILENMNTTPQEEVLKRITSLPDIRRDKVLEIRRQLTEGTYEVADWLDRAMDRVLEAITT